MPNRVKKWIQFLLFGVLLSTLVCCEEETHYRLTSAERSRIDTLYTKQVKGLSQKMDSLCQEIYDGMVERAVDSIIRIRREEEARLRERMRKSFKASQ